MKNYFLPFLCALVLSQGIYFNVKAQTATELDNIIITNNALAVSGLVQLGQIETFKSDFFNSASKIRKKAELDLKKQALSKGANIILITLDDFSNRVSADSWVLHLVGTLYKGTLGAGNQQSSSDNTGTNTAENIVLNIDNGLNFKIVSCVGDAQAQTVTFSFMLINQTKPDQTVTVYNHTDFGGDVGFATAYNEENSKLTCNFIKLANNSVSGYNNIRATLINGLTLKGSVTFINVLPTSTELALIDIPIRSANLEDNSDDRHGIIKIKNVKIDWGGKADEVTTSPQATVENTIIKNINNGIDFNVTDCTGDASKQRVTLFFSFSNPRKVNQKIQVGNSRDFGYSVGLTVAYDGENNLYNCNAMTLANNTSNDYNDIYSALNYGTTLKGSATFIGVLPTITQLSLIKLPMRNSNFDGGEGEMHGFIEIRNIAINWNNNTSPRGINNGSITSSNYITYEQLINKLNKGEKATNAKVILNNIYFETNAATLTEASKSHLGNIMLLLVKYPGIKVTFTGNTDNVGRDDDNLNLSTQRAKSVVDYLVSRGISRDRLFYQGLGSTKPIADNTTDEGRAKNRRTEMQIISQ